MRRQENQARARLAEAGPVRHCKEFESFQDVQGAIVDSHNGTGQALKERRPDQPAVVVAWTKVVWGS